MCKEIRDYTNHYTGKDASDMDHKTLDNIFQEINDEFSEMKPTGIDDLESRVLAAMYKLGAYLMEKKVEDWSDQVRNETCPECGTKLEHKRKKRQIATLFSYTMVNGMISGLSIKRLHSS
jgi:hypothetical protein